MTAIRVGTDLVNVHQVEGAIAEFGDAYLRRVYTAREIQHCLGATGAPVAERLAARFAAKEAAIKVLRPTDGVALTDIEVTVARDGAPGLALSGAAAECSEELDLVDWSLSLTHDGFYAAAVLVALSGKHSQPDLDQSMHAKTAQESTVNERTEVIRNLIEKHGSLTVPVSDLRGDTSLYGAGLTSHATVNVMLAVENEFDIEFPASLLRRSTFESIDTVCAAVEGVLGSEE